ncbi:MAG: acetyl-CoA carboxylase carboxyltransferase subunit beta [Chloroflexi bacterium]|nr:acetyl-CoA carboxylase carboxyltransferase subunit beta [Chloroflexota bacterium]
MPNPFHREPRSLTLPAQPQQQDLPADLWVRCENERCRQQLYVKEVEKNFKVCQKCNHHFRLSARERIALLVDEGSFQEHDADLKPADPLGFVSLGQSYPDKLHEVQHKTGLTEAAVCGSARLAGLPLELAVLDFGFLGASMASVVGEKVTRAAERAIARHVPLVTVSCSGGARMHEGILSLMQMAKTSAAVARLHAARLPLLSVLTDPTTGGVTSSFAGLGDVLIAEPGAIIGFAGPRVIEQVTKQKLPPDAQRAEFLLEHGMVDLVVHRRDLRATLARLLRLYGAAGPSPNGRR